MQSQEARERDMRKVKTFDLIELLALSDAATPPGWVYEHVDKEGPFTSIGWPVGEIGDTQKVEFGSGIDAWGACPVIDAKLICMCRNLIAPLICEILTLRGDIDFSGEFDNEEQELKEMHANDPNWIKV